MDNFVLAKNDGLSHHCPLAVKKVKLNVGLNGKRTGSKIESIMAVSCVCGAVLVTQLKGN